MSAGRNGANASDAADDSATSGSETDDECEMRPSSAKQVGESDDDDNDNDDDSDSSSGSSSSDDSDSDASQPSAQPIPLTDHEAALLKEKASKLEQELAENPYVYETYAALVDIYARSDDWWPELESVLQKFHSQFPLTERHWLMWLNGRKTRMGAEPSTGSIAELRDLFENAVNDYLSIDLWLEYALFGIRCLSVEQTRSIFTRARRIAGYHFSEGSKIWSAFRDFELINIRKCGNDTDAKHELILQLNDLFMDQMKIPQKNLTRVHGEWLEFKEDIMLVADDAAVRKLQQQTVTLDNVERLARDWQTFEDRLKVSTNELQKFQIYNSYIDSVTNQKEHLSTRHKTHTIHCLLERLVSECCLYPYAWILYLDCVQKQDGSEPDRKSTTISVAERAIRNVPYDGSIWAYYLNLMDRFGYTHDQITERFETVLRTGFTDGSMYVDVWLAYIEHFCRITTKRDPDTIERLRKVFEQALSFVQYYDSACRIARLFAWAQAAFFDDLSAMRQTYTSVLNSGANAQQLEFWLELAALERQFGDVKHERKTWMRAFDNVRDLRPLAGARWLDFEVKAGSAETVLYCRARLNRLTFEKVTSSNASQQKQRQKQVTVKKTANAPKKPPPVPKKQSTANETGTPAPKPASLCSTLFIKGLPARATVDWIAELFAEYGVDANSIRTITDRKTQKLKNFAYVDLADKEVARRAIDALNGKSVGADVPLFVAFSDPPKKQTDAISGMRSSVGPTTQRSVKKKLDCALIPTVVKRQKLDESATGATKTEPEKATATATTSLSNADFRKKFLL